MKSKAETPSLAVNSIFNVFYQCVAVIAPLIISMHVSRVLMPEGVGVVATANNLVSYFVTLAPLGIPAYGLREIAKVRNSREKQDVLFSELFVLNAASSLIFLGVYLVLYQAVFSASYDARLYYVFSSLILMNCLNVDWFYQGREDYVYIALRSIVVKLTSLVLIFVFVRSSSDIVPYAVILCFGSAGNYVLNALRLRKFVHFRIKDARPLRHLSAVVVLAGTVVLFSVYTKISITLLGVFESSENVAYYSNAYSAANVVLMFCNAVTGVFFPRFSYEYEHDRTRFHTLVSEAVSVNLFVSLPLAVGVCVVSPAAIGFLFGDAFAPAAVVLRVFSLLIVFKCVGNVVYQVCISTCKERGQLISYTVGAAVCTIGNIVIIPIFGEVGAAVSTVIAELLVDVCLIIYLGSCFCPKVSSRFILSTLVSLVAMTVVAAACMLLCTNYVSQLALSFVFGGGSYLVVAFLTRNDLLLIILGKVKKRL